MLYDEVCPKATFWSVKVDLSVAFVEVDDVDDRELMKDVY